MDDTTDNAAQVTTNVPPEIPEHLASWTAPVRSNCDLCAFSMEYSNISL